jgi:hypothetical protein
MRRSFRLWAHTEPLGFDLGAVGLTTLEPGYHSVVHL